MKKARLSGVDRGRNPETLGWFRSAVNVCYALLLVIMALFPSPSRVVDISIPDWVAHATAYGIQAALLYWASLSRFGHGRSLAVGFTGAVVFGGLTEGLQLLQPGRSVEFKDLVANTIGAALVCSFIAGAFRVRVREDR